MPKAKPTLLPALKKRRATVLLSSLKPDPRNERTHPTRNLELVEGSFGRFGQVEDFVVQERTGRLIAGHGRKLALEKMGHAEIYVEATYLDVTDEEAEALRVVLNRTAATAGWDANLLDDTLKRLEATGWDIENVIGFNAGELDAILADLEPKERREAKDAELKATLAERFVVPPFSVLDARAGYWRDRKRAWLGIGLKSEVGRGENPPNMSDPMRHGGYIKPGKKAAAAFATQGTIRGKDGELQDLTGTSIFDPVLCELAIRWFSPQGGRVLDPFAGGSVRGIVTAMLGRHYTGIELHGEQVRANKAQWDEIMPRFRAGTTRATETPPERVLPQPGKLKRLTPVEEREGIFVKRDDLFDVGGARGAKARSALAIVEKSIEEANAKGHAIEGLIAAGSTMSPMLSRVALVAKHLGLKARLHTSQRKDLTPEMAATQAAGGELILHNAGRLNVCISRAKKEADARPGWLYIPWGLEHEEAIRMTQQQVANLPLDAKRLIVPVGSGMTLAGILHALKQHLPDSHPKILGVCVGQDPTERLDKWAPKDWRERVTLIPAATPYEEPAAKTLWWGIDLDPYYEAKAAAHAEPGDVFWCVARGSSPAANAPSLETAAKHGAAAWLEGDSRDLLESLPEEQFDLIFSCPPYADLEVYSDDPRDLSTMNYADFRRAYTDIIEKSVARLKPNRFIVWVVGEVRDSEGNYRGFIPDTIRAFEKAGAHYYNEAILVTSAGTLPLRAARVFTAGRKLGKTHQNVLVFFKGDDPTILPAITARDIGNPADDAQENNDDA